MDLNPLKLSLVKPLRPQRPQPLSGGDQEGSFPAGRLDDPIFRRANSPLGHEVRKLSRSEKGPSGFSRCGCVDHGSTVGVECIAVLKEAEPHGPVGRLAGQRELHGINIGAMKA